MCTAMLSRINQKVEQLGTSLLWKSLQGTSAALSCVARAEAAANDLLVQSPPSIQSSSFSWKVSAGSAPRAGVCAVEGLHA